MTMDITYGMTLRDVVTKYGMDALDMKIVDVAVLAEAKQRQREDGLSPDMTLSEVYWKSYRPEVSEIKEVCKHTMQQRETALQHWINITGDPPLKEITKKTMSIFVKGMKTVTYLGELLAPRTIKKHCMALRSILNHAGPKTPKNSDALELIPCPPPFPPIKGADWVDTTSKTPTMQEFRQIIRHTDVAQYPQLPGITPGRWWQIAYLFIYYTGLRYREVMSVRWQDIRMIRGRWSLVIRAADEKMHQERIMPLHPALLSLLEELPRLHSQIFFWPMSYSTFRRVRRKIVVAAMVAPKRATWHPIRRLVGTIVPEPSLVLGHRRVDTTLIHYQAVERIGTALAALPSPIETEETRKDVCVGYG